MSGLLDKLRAKVARDHELGWVAVARKGASYAASVASARLYLHGVTKVGVGVRTVGRPRIDNQGTMELGDHVLLRSVNVPVELTTARGALLVVGEDTFLNYGTSIGVTGEVRLGRRVNVGPYVMIVDTEFHDRYDRMKVPAPAPVFIDDDVFLGAKCSVMPGVRIGKAAIVGTASVVTRDVEPFTVVGGVPARVISRLDASRFVERPR
jgi:acetyltransferase-like isoleucine patch superfamily enzyme